MLTIQNATDLDGKPVELTIDSADTVTIDATGLTVFPGLIDPHVHFRVPGQDYKEDWMCASKAAIAGGYTTVFDMPNNIPSCVSLERLHDKKAVIDQQLRDSGVPLRYQLYIGADKNHFHEIPKVKDEVIGIKVFMGASTGELLMDDESSLHAIFALAAAHDLLIAVHAEDEAMIQARQAEITGDDFATHSKIRSPEVAASAVKLAISLSELYGVKLYVLHTSTQLELSLITEAQQRGVPVYAEVCPHHLFMNTTAYAELAGRAQMNPPLRAPSEQPALFQAIRDGLVMTIGSDHAPHTTEEKDQAYGCCPSGVPGIETTLPLLLTAYHDGLLSLQDIVRVTCHGPRELFNLPANNDVVLVDLNKKRRLDAGHLHTKCAWSPFMGKELTGWPVYTIVNGYVFDLEQLS